MPRKLFFLMLLLSFMLILSGVAFAQADDDDDDDDDDDNDDNDDTSDDDDDDAADDDDDDTSFEDSYAAPDAPDSMEANTPYDFEFTVYNAATFNPDEKGEWIYAVDLTMPSENYSVDETNLAGPSPLHGSVSEGEYQILGWEANFDPTSTTITWQAFGVVTSANYGDIREGEMLSFQFSATTDDVPTDGFHWVLRGDMGTDVEGDFYINELPDDDDDDDDDDTSGDDDDDSGGGCGC